MAKGDGKSALFVFVTVVLDAMGIGIIVPVLPDLLQELTGLTVGQAAIWGGYLTFSYALAQFVCSPILGALSDRFGRRPVLLVSVAMLAVDYVVMALAPTLWILFVGRILAGIAGATYSTATAYIADVTPREKRAAAFGLVGAGFGIGFVLGPVLGGFIGEIGTRAPFYAAAALAFANFAYGLIVLPESLPTEKRRPFEMRRANPFGAFRQMSNLPMVTGLVAVAFLYAFSHYVYPSVWSYYTKENFDWSPSEIGQSLALVGVGFAVVQMAVIRIFLRLLGEVWTVYIGLVLNAVGLVGIAMATQGWMIYALIPLVALGDVVKPALNGLTSNRVPDDQQGELQGVLSSSQALTTVLSPLLMTQIFGAFAGPDADPYLPGAPFLASALIMVSAAFVFRMAAKPQAAAPGSSSDESSKSSP
ncbi:MAG: TCR/Tet family MFS transporter [Pseudomonadota bacterium]